MSTYIGTNDNDVMIGSSWTKDRLFGLFGDDIINGGSRSDYIEGNEGNDILIGGGGADSFGFNFTKNQSAFTLVDSFVMGNAANFLNDYKAWAATFGSDLNGDGNVRVDWVNNLTNYPTLSIEGLLDSNLQFTDINSQVVNGVTYYYYENAEVVDFNQTVLSTNDGHDIITDFSSGGERLKFNIGGNFNIQKDDFSAMFDVVNADTNTDGKIDTVVSLEDNSFSVTLQGVNMTSDALYNYVNFI